VSIDQVSANIDARDDRDFYFESILCPSIRLVPTSTPFEV